MESTNYPSKREFIMDESKIRKKFRLLKEASLWMPGDFKNQLKKQSQTYSGRGNLFIESLLLFLTLTILLLIFQNKVEKLTKKLKKQESVYIK